MYSRPSLSRSIAPWPRQHQRLVLRRTPILICVNGCHLCFLSAAISCPWSGFFIKSLSFPFLDHFFDQHHVLIGGAAALVFSIKHIAQFLQIGHQGNLVIRPLLSYLNFA